jgi:hypothetical protein
VIITGVTVKLMVKGNVAELVWCIGMAASVTVNVGLVVPLLPAKGTPLIVPGDKTFNTNPFGNTGFTDQA